MLLASIDHHLLFDVTVVAVSQTSNVDYLYPVEVGEVTWIGARVRFSFKLDQPVEEIVVQVGGI